MLNMENAEEVMQILERFTRLKQKEIPKELDDYMNYVAKTGDTVFKWSSLKYLFREKLLNVIKNFHDTSPRVDDLPQYPNVDPFNYESMKSSLLERLELFNAAPFTIQRLCELLTEPRKQYSRIDKFMRALEKNILVVSTIEPGRKRTESENGDSLDSVVNGDASLEVNVDIDMENEPIINAEPPNATSSPTPVSQPSSILIHKADDDILPNPKKPKLDLDEKKDAETEAATQSITSNKKDTAELSVEKVIADESGDITDKKKKEERVAEENTVSEEKPSTVNATASAEITVVADVKKDVKDSECEKMEEDTPAAAPTTESNNVDDKKEEAENKAEEKLELITTSRPAEVAEVDKESPPTSTPVAAVEAIKTAENPEKIDDAPEGNKKDCTEKVVEKQETAKDIEAGKVIKENDDDKENHNGDVKENKEKTETTITTTNTEKIDETKPDSAMEEAIATNEEEKSEEEIVKEKIVVEEVVGAAVAVVVEDSKKEVTEAPKTGVNPSVVSEEPSKPEEAKPAGETVTAAIAASVPVEETKELNTSNTAEPVAKIVAADPPPPATESLQKESLETPAEIKPSEPKENEAEKAAEIPVATAAPPTESKDVVVTVPVVVAAAAAEPVLTADQPMEENPETIAEAEPVVPTIAVEAAANVEEVEMATDVIEPAKDEPAGMEVDDTSQEAMDQ